jgi:two-component system chemotaxis response regulator CheB
MQSKVLVVDDSRFYRNRLCEIIALDKNIQVVGTAEDGREAVEKTIALKPDVITMDVEMPVMDGISAVREIMKKRPTPILMLSSLTAQGAQATFDALDAGAVDFLLKRLDKLSSKNSEFADALCGKIRILAGRAHFIAKQGYGEAHSGFHGGLDRKADSQAIKPSRREERSPGHHKIVVIGASTGGPVAVQSILSALPADFPVPILVVQHMPASFTGSFARRLNTLSKLAIKEAADGDVVAAGMVYVAPGGKQMIIEDRAGQSVIRIRESYESEQYKPSVDVSYKSVAEVYRDTVLAIILTGMGADGRDGANLLKRSGSAIWVQDERTSVVYGMPQAVIEAGLADRILPIAEIAHQLAVGV